MIRTGTVAALAGVLALVPTAHAETPSTPRAPRVVTFEVDVDSLPRGDLPAMLAESDRPKPLPEGFTRGQGISVTRVGTSYEVAPEATVPASVQTMRPTTTPQPKTTVTCDTKETRAPWPLRWESIGLAPDGNASVTVRDGWMDVRACKVSMQRETALAARPVAFQDGAPLVFAMREGDALTFLLPPSDTAAGDASSGAVKWQRGAVSRVRLPISRGGSSAVAISLDGARAAAWVAQLAGKKAVNPVAGPMTIRIEASQAVGEDRPTVLIRVVGP